MSTGIRYQQRMLRALAAVFLSVAVMHLAVASWDRLLWPVVPAALALIVALHLEDRAHRSREGHVERDWTALSPLSPVRDVLTLTGRGEGGAVAPIAGGAVDQTPDSARCRMTTGALMRKQIGPYCTISTEAGPRDGIGVVRLGGEVDSTVTDELWRVVAAETAHATQAMVIGLAEVTYFDSAGLSLLVDSWQAAHALGIRFVVAADHRAVLKPLHITRLDTLMQIRPDLEQALAAAVPAGHPPISGS